MAKGYEELDELVRKADLVLEVLDARLPCSSSNQRFEMILRNRRCIKILNKKDLADPMATKAWVRFFEREPNIRAIPLSARLHSDAKQLLRLCRALVPNRGKPGYPIRITVAGVPNCGKSTLINTLSGRSLAKVADKPAITTSQQRIDLKNGIVITDTPGLLLPEMCDQEAAYRLAASGAIAAGAFDSATVALFALEYLVKRYPHLLEARYASDPLSTTPAGFLLAVGKRLGCISGGGEVDLYRSAEAFLRELRSGKLGRITLEAPEDIRAEMISNREEEE